jgi:uncharacterized protein (DUF427 family)
MSLTLGSAPFGREPGGVFNFERTGPEHVLYWERSPRRVRGELAGETVVDSTAVMMLHETGHLPIYYFPETDVRGDLLEASDHSTHCPFKGDAAYVSVRVGDRVAENAAWTYREPLDGAAPLAGYLAFYWGALDRWLEEDEEVFVHPRDPYHRVDVLDTSRHVTISLAGERLADTRRARVLLETGLPPRWYLPAEDVRPELLEESETLTQCPYKGTASYRSLRLGDRVEEDLVWLYADPLPSVAPIAGRLCFFDERVDVEIDGELQERPHTRWSPHDED